MRSLLLAVSVAIGTGCATTATVPAFSQSDLIGVLESLDPEARDGPGGFELTFAGVRMACISDPRFGRMRIIAPIVALAEVTATQHARILEANFHSALDARYATSQGVLYAAFIHPLPPLSEGEVRSAVRQVASLVLTFGSTYSSGELVYQGSEQAL